MDNTPKVIAPEMSADAVLSQSLQEQVEDFATSQADALDQTHDHPYVWQHRRSRQTRLVEHHPLQPWCDRHGRSVASGLAGRHLLWIDLGLRYRGRRNLTVVAAAIQPLLLRLPGRRLVVGRAPLAGLLPAMMLAATKRTTQVPPTCVAGMREEPNPAVGAVSDAALKLGMRLQQRVQRGLILPNKRRGAIVLMPIRAKREKFLHGDGKKARLSVILSIVLYTPSSYPFDANASRGRTRFFVRHARRLAQAARTNSPLPTASPPRPACRVAPDVPRVTFREHYLEEGSRLLLSK